VRETDDYDWLREIARNSEVGASFRWLHQLRLPHILIRDDELATEDPYDLVFAIEDFTTWALRDALFIAGEFPQEALWCVGVMTYVIEVDNGGHGQFVGNTCWSPVTIGGCERGLRAIGADDYAAIFSDLKKLIESDSDRAAKIAEGYGFGDIDSAIRDLDDRFFALDGTDRVGQLNADWIRTLPQLRALSRSDLAVEKEVAERSNTLRQQRRDNAK